MSNDTPTSPAPTNLNDQFASFVLWIDGVGGYLLCLSHRLTIGRPQAESAVDIALIADVSRHHATIQRDPEGYYLEAVRKIQVNGQAMDKTLLRNGDRVTLGNSCQLQFWQPVPVSTSARVDIVSGHRFAQPVQAALLMADTLVIGPATQSHVQVPDMTQALIVFRNKTGLALRWPGTLEINGVQHRDRAPLTTGAAVITDQLTLTLERVQ